MLEDLVYTRTHDLSCITVVEGANRRLYPTMGETQGGLFSALRYVVAKEISVDAPLEVKFGDIIQHSIIDDGIAQLLGRKQNAS